MPRAAAERPQAVALVSGDEVVSYGELEARANRLAHYLRGRLGLMPDRLVGLLLERSSDLIVAMLAVLKAGAAYLPLDMNAPPERLGFMLADGEAAAVLSTGANIAALPAGTAPVILLDAEAAAIAACAATPPDCVATAESLAYVMYTSGSTGRPKGVCVPHRAVVRLVKNTDYARFCAADVFLQYAPVSFDASTFEIWGALLNGAKLVLMAPRQESLEALGRTIAEQGVTTLWLTASLFNLMIEEQPDALSGLEQLLVGGEALSVAHIRRARAALPGCRLINGYGPTECTTFSCCHTITDVDERGLDPDRGADRQYASLCSRRARRIAADRHCRRALYRRRRAGARLSRAARAHRRAVRGDGRSSGGSTAPATSCAGGATARSSFLGRRDDQVKLRGFRIELRRNRSRVAAGRGGERSRGGAARRRRSSRAGRLCGGSGGERSARCGGAAPAAAHACCRTTWCRRASWCWMRLPLTANGKVDRRAASGGRGERAAGACASAR